jgi:hypothetical protein
VRLADRDRLVTGGPIGGQRAHTYTQSGNFTTTITVDQTGGGSATATGKADVTAAPLQAGGLIHKLSAAGVPANNLIVATFSDSGGSLPPSSYTASIHFGDGTTGTGTITFSGGTFTVTASHTFSNQGTYVIMTTIQSLDGRTATADSTVAVGYVAGIYLDLLHRAVDPGGLAAWNTLLGRGLTRQQVVTDIEASKEYRTDVVQAIYSQVLHRNADSFGLNAFVNALGSGLTLVQVEAIIFGSQEFFNDSGGTNSGFVTALYQDLLGRSPDTFGLNAFVGAINAGASRQAVASAILSSDEYHRDLIGQIYLQFLRRPADSFGLGAFAQAMDNGLTEEAVLSLILGSPEYAALSF